MGLTLTYMYTNNIGVELLAAIPFSHVVDGTGGLTGVAIAEVKHLPPTLTVNYYPLASSSKVQPYIGAGINYTYILDTDSKIAGTDVDFDSSWA